MLTLFTVPKAFVGHIGLIQRNAIRSWQACVPDAQIMLFGCDACGEHCPHNQRPLITADPAFTPKTELLELPPEEILKLTRSEFKRLFGGTPIWRIGLKRLKRNASAVLANLEREVPEPLHPN